jgi:cation/acetate symporter
MINGIQLGQPSPSAIGFFLLFVATTLGITYWAARRTHGTKDYYTAGARISGLQNGVALAGDYASAATFMGIGGLVALSGLDGLLYAIGALVGWVVLLLLIAEPLRRIGKYTFADVIAHRLDQRPVRMAAAFSTLTIVILYLLLQMVGAGALITLLFGLPYEVAVVVVGMVMLAYVLFGGMLATTWVQIIKALLLVGGSIILAVITLARFGFNPIALFATVGAEQGAAMLAPGNLFANPIEGISLGLGMALGTASLPHILMRFYTVPNARAARNSVFYATGLLAVFMSVVFVLGLASANLVGKPIITSVDKGGNLALPLLAAAVGGAPFLGFISAVAFATILAVVAGLTLSGAACVSHDLWVNVVRRGTVSEAEQLKVARIAAVCLGVASIVLGLMFKGQNVSILGGFVLALAASANFPALLLSITWRRFTTAGAVTSIVTGVVVSIVLFYLCPTVQTDVLGNSNPLFPLRNPGIVTIPLSFVVGIVVSLLTHEQRADERVRELTLHGAAAAH